MSKNAVSNESFIENAYNYYESYLKKEPTAKTLVLEDQNNNGLDHIDLKIIQNKPENFTLSGHDIGNYISEKVQNTPTEFILLGETHRWVPSSTISPLIRSLKASNYHVNFGYELPPVNPETKFGLQNIADQFNQGNLIASRFSEQITNLFKNDPFYKTFINENRDNVGAVVQNIVSAAQAGAQISFIDKNYRASIDEAPRETTRDQAMAENAMIAHKKAKLKTRNKVITIIGAGLTHTQERPAMQKSQDEEVVPSFFVDKEKTMGRILSENYSDEQIYSTAFIGDIIPNFMKNTAIQAWDDVYYLPDGSYYPDMLD